MQTVVDNVVPLGVAAFCGLFAFTVTVVVRAGVLRLLNRRYPFKGFDQL